MARLGEVEERETRVGMMPCPPWPAWPWLCHDEHCKGGQSSVFGLGEQCALCEINVNQIEAKNTGANSVCCFCKLMHQRCL